jgi:hypothetical protein
LEYGPEYFGKKRKKLAFSWKSSDKQKKHLEYPQDSIEHENEPLERRPDQSAQ